MKDHNQELLEIFFKKHLKFFNNDFILELLFYYKNKTAMADSKLYHVINNDK